MRAPRHEARRASSFASAHLGPWERVAASIVSSGVPLIAVARESYNPRFSALFERIRYRAGVRVIWRGRPGAAARILRALRRGEVLGIPMDIPIPGRLAPGPIPWDPRADSHWPGPPRSHDWGGGRRRLGRARLGRIPRRHGNTYPHRRPRARRRRGVRAHLKNQFRALAPHPCPAGRLGLDARAVAGRREYDELLRGVGPWHGQRKFP